ncbi:MAG TPA: hypothetical protein VK174_02060 [Chitinophagales bacterium]|nr:hypothetical protein [Chitinophagales bacterium]
MDFIKRTFPLLFGIFLLSVAVRLPQLNRPLSKHHEFCTAISLRIMQIWYDKGIGKYGYNPVMTYNNPADKFINNSANQSGRMIDKEGNYYYVSHPPFAYYAPFFVFKLLHIRPDVLPLQIFNLLLHFISGLFVYFTVCLLSFNRARSLPYRSAIVAFTIYIFLPVTLWFQGNVYMSDMAVHLLFVIGVYTALKMIIRRKFYSPKYIFFYVLTLALMIYTSWLGVFFAGGVIVYSLLHIRGELKGFRVLLWSTVIVTLLMLRLIVYQYSQINGVGAYIEEMLSRYIVRGSLEGTDQGLWSFMFSYLWLIKTLFYNYIIHYIVMYALIGAFLYLAFSRKKLKIVFSENGYRFIWLSVTPVVLLHVVFLNYSVQDFSVLYASLFFSVVLGMLYDKVKKSGAVPLRTMQISLVITLVLMVAQYQVMNMPNVFKLVRYEQRDYGQDVQRLTKKNEVIFSSATIEPQEIFYAQRNIRYAANREEALQFLKQTNQKNGVIVSFYNRKEIGKAEIVERISLDSSALNR